MIAEARFELDWACNDSSVKTPSLQLAVMKIYTRYWYEECSEQLGWIHVNHFIRLKSNNQSNFLCLSRSWYILLLLFGALSKNNVSLL